MSTPTGNQRIRLAVIGAWPVAAGWPDAVWQQWATHLASFTDDELEHAITRLARTGREHPPGWGVVYRAAHGALTARKARESEQAWLAEGDAP